MKSLMTGQKGYELEGAKILLFTDSWQKKDSIPEQYWLDRKAFELIRLERMGLRQILFRRSLQ